MGIKANVRATGWNLQEKVAQPGRKVVPEKRSTMAVKGGFVVEREKGVLTTEKSAERSDGEGEGLSRWLFNNSTVQLAEVFSWGEEEVSLTLEPDP